MTIRGLLQYAANAADDPSRPFVVCNDIFEDFAQFLQIEPIGCQKTLCGLRVAQNRRQRLIELVDQRPGALIGAGALLSDQVQTAPPPPPLRNERRDQHQLDHH